VSTRIAAERFRPSVLGAFVNPNFPTRRRIAAFVRRHAELFTGDVLDFGGGEMPYRRLAAARSWRSVEYATSLAGPDVPALARESRLAGQHVYYDGRHVPLPDGSVDVVLATEVFERLFNLDEILSELHRVLRPGGRLVATIPFAMYEHEVPHDFARYTSFAIRQRLEGAGFAVERIEKLSGMLEVWLQMTTWLWWERARRGSRLAWIGLPSMPIVNLLSWLLEGRDTSASAHFLTLGIVACKPTP
jgi:SAM-dependent methyltransferase